MTYAERLTELLVKYAKEGLSFEDCVVKVLEKMDNDISKA